MLLKDKVIVVNGVGAGLGQAMARIAAADGAKLVLAARTQTYLDEVADAVRAGGGEAIAIATDIADAGQCEALAEAAVAAFGRIDGLVNSAFRSGEKGSVETLPLDEFQQCFDISCLGALRMARAVLPAMREAGGGAIVNISTMGSVLPFAGQAAYAVAKGGMNTLTRYMAQEFAPHGIRVNLARMGWIGGATVNDYIEGAVAAGGSRETIVGAITQRIPLGIIPPEDDCARAALLLLSDYAKVVNGAVLDVNGGEHMAL